MSRKTVLHITYIYKCSNNYTITIVQVGTFTKTTELQILNAKTVFFFMVNLKMLIKMSNKMIFPWSI